MYNNYSEVFQQQISDDIIEQININFRVSQLCIWIPYKHFLKTDKQVTTKIKTVLDCSLNIGQTPSLNKAAYPKIGLMNSLLKLSCEFRRKNFIMVGDVRQAFLQIKLK